MGAVRSRRSRLRWLASQPAVVLRLSLGVLLVLGLVDYLTGSELGLSIFYALPVAAVAWASGKLAPAALTSAVGAAVWLAVDLTGGPIYANPAAPYWNAGVRLGFFLIIALVVARLRDGVEERNRLIERLRLALEERDRTAQELARSNADLEEYAHVAAHDLRTPLVTISGYAQLIRQRHGASVDPSILEMLAQMERGAKRMYDLIGDLLDYARVGASGGPVDVVDAGEVLDRALENLQGLFEKHAASVSRDPLPRLPANPSQLERVFQNLIANAIQFRGEEPPRVHISATLEGPQWVFAVRDNGVGLPPEAAHELFRPFGRLPATSHVPGTGIGLAVCKKIVEAHRGQIWVESHPGPGATFRFSLPAEIRAEATPNSGPTPAPLSAPSARDCRSL